MPLHIRIALRHIPLPFRFSSLKAAMALPVICLMGAGSTATAQVTLVPKRATAYTGGVGVNTHLRYTHLPYYTQFETLIYPKLKALGIKHVRDNFPHPGFLGNVSASLMRSRYLKLYDSCGIRFCYLLDSRRTIDTTRFLNDAAYLELFATNPELIKTIQHFEGFNEPDRNIRSWYPATWTTLTHTIQQTLWSRTHNTPALDTITIIGPSAVMYGPHPSLPDSMAMVTPHISNYYNYANYHPYDVNGGPNYIYPGARYNQDSVYYDTLGRNKPWIATEIGYPNARGFNNPAACAYSPISFHYTPELAAGKYYSIAFMELFHKGATRVYAYELIDQNTADQGDAEKNFGLLRTDGSEKPAFTAIKNTLRILQDTGVYFATTPLTLTLTGDTTGLHYSLYQKSNGQYLLALWPANAASAVYDYTTFTDIVTAPKQVLITLATTADSIRVYQPLNTALPLYQYATRDTLTVTVPDHLLLVELTPGATARHAAARKATDTTTFTPNNKTAAKADNGIYVNPNPFTTAFTVHLPAQQQVMVYDAAGRQLYQRMLPAGTHTINMGGQPAGIYYLRYGRGKSVRLLKL